MSHPDNIAPSFDDPGGEETDVLHLSTSDLGHGAGIAAFRLHQGLRAKGVNSRMLVNEKLSADPFVHLACPKPETPHGLFWRDLKHFVETSLNFSAFQNIYSVTGQSIRSHPLFRRAKLIHLHNIHAHVRNIFSVRLFHALRDQPVVWTLHDMWPLSGHCTFSYDCDRWLSGCGDCPHLAVYIRLLLDSTALLFNLKKRLYKLPRLTVVAPSQWLAGIAARSPLFGGRAVRCIPYGVDAAVMKPMDRSMAKQQLGLPLNGCPAILFIAYSLNDSRKGFHFFAEAVKAMWSQGIGCSPVICGSGQYFADLKDDPRTVNLGLVTEPERLALIYSAADLMVIPSLQDNLPNTALESLACGTPVLCYRTGGLPDMVRHLETGYIVERKDGVALTAGLSELLGLPDRLGDMRAKCRETILSRFTLQHQASEYAVLYDELRP